MLLCYGHSKLFCDCAYSMLPQKKHFSSYGVYACSRYIFYRMLVGLCQVEHLTLFYFSGNYTSVTLGKCNPALSTTHS